jgi:hypothetical protein
LVEVGGGANDHDQDAALVSERVIMDEVNPGGLRRRDAKVVG